ncbi:hypothetical protein PHYBLDRAFT_165535 [Phycomyces blakesleeanus NRRL 1555(-)]|uniref:Uncharacterized protein n=1 Tax=Phycomyces blakesleeanus (strain ATCC 8743b / DSM 1359 / FGSC 10004 / NBRC 33097 / NRRL 1555) TaxID=763407 RepID=A0A162UQC0_PHYB8|nr:hypothetical protein PHYBLDRAFT_165535 [Phycomyces blakesleeanus NRRL 1555(-)]OAD77043.1 hypothetical protein PHYBLDRAFT_165535 [Phycomyces blakesleeanus NRRL 1555(-)]|eukprot:XP_018295083.1 hypothetical protein PHYBLDRAFT_165535 [Phycomyces blakesleeanus NRRL 1555(-)]
MDSFVSQRTTASRFHGNHVYHSDPWAADCLMISREGLGKCNIGTVLFIMNASFLDDQMIQQLYSLVLSNEEKQYNNIVLPLPLPSPLLETQNQEYETLLSIANIVGPSNDIPHYWFDIRTLFLVFYPILKPNLIFENFYAFIAGSTLTINLEDIGLCCQY